MPDTTSTAVTIYHGWPGPSPLPSSLMQTLNSVEATQSDQAPSTFRLDFLAERTPSDIADFRLLAEQTLAPGTRVTLVGRIGLSETVIIDGFTTNIDMAPSFDTKPGTIIVSGEDVSVAMSLYQYSVEYPLMPDAAIAETVLAKWATLGIVPLVVPTASSFSNVGQVPQQATDDRSYLQGMAADHGYIFCIMPGPVLGMNTAYWGPPLRFLPTQPVLGIDLDASSTVTNVSFCFDGLQPEHVWGSVLDITTNLQFPVFTAASTVLPWLATRPALDTQGLFTRTSLFNHAGMNILQAAAKAQAVTDNSTARVVTASGTLDGLRYGSILTAPGVVSLRGAGQSFNGLYSIQSVTHRFGRETYTQDFVLAREGLGSTVASV